MSTDAFMKMLASVPVPTGDSTPRDELAKAIDQAYEEAFNQLAGGRPVLGPVPRPSPRKKNVSETPISPVDQWKQSLRDAAAKGGDALVNQKYKLINEVLLGPHIADLTNQHGLVHSTYIGYNQYERRGSVSYCVSIYRERPKGLGFWNAVGRFFGTEQEVLRIEFNGQLWVVNYYVASYFVVAEEIKEAYVETWKGAFGGKDMVIVGRR